MIQRAEEVLPRLYESDETAWLEPMSEPIQQGRLDDLDYPPLVRKLRKVQSKS